jgi:hypothetical protein
VAGVVTAQSWPATISEDPRIIILGCRACQRQWPVLIPEQNAKAFCHGLACDCGADREISLNVDGGVEKLRMIIHGQHS